MSQPGINQIMAERERQIHVKEYKPAGDKGRATELGRAAACYHDAALTLYQGELPNAAGWPWDLKYWKPTTTLRCLVKAGALYEAARDAAESTFEADVYATARDKCAEEIDGVMDTETTSDFETNLGLARKIARFWSEWTDDNAPLNERHVFLRAAQDFLTKYDVKDKS